jgi:hypothetical protein
MDPRLGRADETPCPLQELNNYETGNLIPAGVYTLDDVKKYGVEKGVCPYFTIRRMVRLRVERARGLGHAESAVRADAIS